MSLLLLASVPTGAVDHAGERPRATFVSEDVVITVEPDSLRVEGRYILELGDGTATTTLFYPFPHDADLGGALPVTLERRSLEQPGSPARAPGIWTPAPWRLPPNGSGMFWLLDAAPGARLEVRCVYRQARHADYARYIVTTVHNWGRPLVRATFAVALPATADAPEFSFPFAPGECDGRPCWKYAADDFLPDRDIVVRWR